MNKNNKHDFIDLLSDKLNISGEVYGRYTNYEDPSIFLFHDVEWHPTKLYFRPESNYTYMSRIQDINDKVC